MRPVSENRMVSAAEAIARIKPGQRVVVQPGAVPRTLLRALASRAALLRDVTLILPNPAALNILPEATAVGARIVGGRSGMADREAGDWRCCDGSDLADVDVLLAQVSPPDDSGHCSFGPTLLNKRALADRAGVVLAEVQPHLLRTYGTNRLHQSAVTCFVAVSPEETIAPPAVAGGAVDTIAARIAGHIADLLGDGDTISLGYGTICGQLALAGAFRDKHALGLHSLYAPAGVLRYALAGGFPGNRKHQDAGKVVASDFEVTADIQEALSMHPLFHVRGYSYVSDPSWMAGCAQFVAIHQAAAIDLTGQLVAEEIDGRSQRERARALIAICHPRFRDELAAQADILFWPATSPSPRAQEGDGGVAKQAELKG